MKLLAPLCLTFVLGCTSEANIGYSALGSTRWAVALGGRSSDGGMAIAIDSIGDVVVGGEFTGPATFGGAPIAIGGGWGFLTKRVASDGSERWTVPLLGGAASSAGVSGVAIDGGDNVIVTGSFVGTVDFGGQSLTVAPGNGTMFVAKYTRDGQLTWVHGVGSASNAQPYGIAVDSTGTIFVAGVWNQGTIFLGPQSYLDGSNERDAFLIAYDRDGAVLWGHAYQGPGEQFTTALALAANGDLIVAGSFTSPSSFGGTPLVSDAYAPSYMARYTATGSYVSSRTIGPSGPGGESGGALVAVDPTGMIIVGDTERDDIYAQTLDNDFATVRAFDDSDAERWSARSRTAGTQGDALAVTRGGLIVSGGFINELTADFGTGTLQQGMYLAVHDGSGAVVDAASFEQVRTPGAADSIVRAIASDSDGAVAFTGEMSGVVDFGTGALSTHGQGDYDIVIVMLDPPVTPH